MIQDTSRIAYYTEIKPTVQPREAYVLSAYTQKEHYTNSELSDFLSIPINTVTPRVNSLVKKGILREGGKRYCGITGRKAIAWELNNTPDKKLFF